MNSTKETRLKKLPIGIQDFVDIRENEYHYIDKTEVIHSLVTCGKVFFLSRPRRFGKSLLCSTLGALWEGKRVLFSGLAIDSLDWHWNEHPVVRIDLNAGNYTNDTSELKELLYLSMNRTALHYGVELHAVSLGQRFFELLFALAGKTGKKVAVIIDEYDKPLLNSINNEALHEEFKGILKGFYGVLKSADPQLAFLFITGVTKFSQVSVFSDLNQLQDISLDPRFSDLCGFTQAEVERDFAELITRFSGEHSLKESEYLYQLKRFYNGYRFSQKEITVYNPFGLLNHFTNGQFESYWFSTGTPTFLIKLIEEQHIDILALEKMEVKSSEFADYRKDLMLAVPVLYQAGYLTIKEYDPVLKLFTLDYPNEEVRTSFAESLADKYAYAPEQTRTSLLVKFYRSLKAGNVDGFMETLVPFFAARAVLRNRSEKCARKSGCYCRSG